LRDSKDVANREKMMPRDFISADGFGITDACRKYLQPLIAGRGYPPYVDGLPSYVSLKNESVAAVPCVQAEAQSARRNRLSCSPPSSGLPIYQGSGRMQLPAIHKIAAAFGGQLLRQG
jgi:hypothetical protein